MLVQQSEDNEIWPHLTIQAYNGPIRGLAYLPDGRVVTGSRYGNIKVWDWQSGTSMEHPTKAWDLSVTHDGTKIVSSSMCGTVSVWDVASRRLVKAWSSRSSSPHIAISPDDQLIAVGIWTVDIYTMEGRKVDVSIEVGSFVWSMAFSPAGDKLACGTEDGNVRITLLEAMVKCILTSCPDSKQTQT